VKKDDELVSFDVVSLFNSIPVELAIQVATDVLSKKMTLCRIELPSLLRTLLTF